MLTRRGFLQVTSTAGAAVVASFRDEGLTRLAAAARLVEGATPEDVAADEDYWREIQQAFTGQDVVCLSITCDPDIDTPERLREYAGKLAAPPEQWLFLTGKLIYIRRVAGELFSVALDKQTHTERLTVCDKWGKIRGTFHWNKLDEVTELKLLVAKLLMETEPPPAVEQASSLPGS